MGLNSKITDINPLKESKKGEFPSAFKDFIRRWGAPQGLFSDNAWEETSNDVKDILRHFCIGAKTSEPNQQNQNPAERRVQDVKNGTRAVMDRTGTPAKFWLLCMLYVVSVFNVLVHDVTPSTVSMTPIEIATGQKPDISAFLAYRWWEPVYYYDDSGEFPATREKLGRWVGVSDDCGDVLTYWILTNDTEQVIARSVIRTALDENTQNLRSDTEPSEDGEQTVPLVSMSDIVATQNSVDPSEVSIPKFAP